MSLHGGLVAGVNPTLSIGGPEMSRYPLAGGWNEARVLRLSGATDAVLALRDGDRLSRGHPGLTFPRLGR
jgi:hypothetical protein